MVSHQKGKANKWRVEEALAPVLSLSKGTYKTELEDGIKLAYDDFLNNPMRAER